MHIYTHMHTHIFMYIHTLFYTSLFPKSVKRGEENCLPSVY